VPVVAEHVAGDDQRVETERIASAKRYGGPALVAGNRALCTERRKGDDVNVGASTPQLRLEDAAQGDLAEFAGIERPEEPDQRPPSGTVHVMPPCSRRIGAT
jgi:hypothetical protein